MQYGICPLSIVPLRLEPADASEMVSQILYGECFKIIETRKKWVKIRLEYDNYEGWIDPKQYFEITKEDYTALKKTTPKLSSDLVEFVTHNNDQLNTIVLGSTLNGLELLHANYEGNSISSKTSRTQLISTAFLYLNCPYLWGGKTPFGIDCSGFTQMVYKLCGYKLLRDASQQATQGQALSFIEESLPGDLAFFDNNEGIITHVGIIMEDNYIIHAHGKVRIDRLDHSGIYNVDLKQHTHKLRVIKNSID